MFLSIEQLLGQGRPPEYPVYHTHHGNCVLATLR